MEQMQTARNLDPYFKVLPRQEFEAHLARLQKEWDQARQAHKQSALQKGEEALAKGDPITALSHLYDAQRLEPSNARVRYLTGLACLALGWSQPALNAFEKARSLDPKLSFVARAEWEAKLAEAKAGAQQVGPAQAEVARARQLRQQAEQQLGKGEAEAALSSLQLARSLNPEDPATYYSLARCYLALERFAAARAALEAAKELDPRLHFAAREEFARVEKEIQEKAPPPTVAPPPPPPPPAPPTRPLDFDDAIKALRRGPALVADFSTRTPLRNGDRSALQRIVEQGRAQDVALRFAVIDREMKLPAASFAEQAAAELGLKRGELLIVADETTLAAVSGDLPRSEIAGLLGEARATFRQDRIVAMLQLAHALIERVQETTARRRWLARLLTFALTVASLTAIALPLRRRWLATRSRQRVEARTQFLFQQVERLLAACAPESVPKATLDRWWRAQSLLDTAKRLPPAAAANNLHEAAALLEECLREAKDLAKAQREPQAR